MSKTMGNNDSNGTRKNVPDVQFWGDGDTWKLICKAWSEEEEWMKSTKAMAIHGIGCLVQVTTQNEEMIAEAVTFVPGAIIEETKDDEGKVISRKLVVYNSKD